MKETEMTEDIAKKIPKSIKYRIRIPAPFASNIANISPQPNEHNAISKGVAGSISLNRLNTSSNEHKRRGTKQKMPPHIFSAIVNP